MRKVTEATLARMFLVGPGEAMRQDERDAGHTIIRAGDVPWLPREDWPDDLVIARDGKVVRIVAIWARRPGTGAFSRMIDGIVAEGSFPAVVAPFQAMQNILDAWGWRCADETWFPTREWVERRRKWSELT